MMWTVLAGCMGDSAVIPAVQSPAETLGGLKVSPSVVILAADTRTQLHITPQSLDGDTTIVLDSVVYIPVSSTDTNAVRISRAGEVAAVAPTPGVVRFNVFGYRGKTIKADQVMIYVTENEIPGLTLSIQPGTRDSTKLAMGARKRISASLRNPVTGQELPNPPVRLRVETHAKKLVAAYQPELRPPGTTLSAQIAEVPNVAANEISPKAGEGSAWIHAEVNAYGVMLRDSVHYTFSYPFAATLLATPYGQTLIVKVFTQIATDRTLTLAPGGTLTVSSQALEGDSTTISVSFDGPSIPAAAVPASSAGGQSGDITQLRRFQASARRFLVPGTYTWTMRTGNGSPSPNNRTASGTILVK